MTAIDLIGVLLLLGAAAALTWSAFLVGPALGYFALGLVLLIAGLALLRVRKG